MKLLSLLFRSLGQSASKTLAERPLATNIHIESDAGAYDAAQLFDLDKTGDNTFSPKKLLANFVSSPNVYGGLLFSQSMAAAERTVSEQLKIHSLHSVFIATVLHREPITYRVKALRDGQSFCARLVEAEQFGKIVFSCQLSFHKDEEAAVKHQLDMPKVPLPDQCLELYDGIENLLKRIKSGELAVDPGRIALFQKLMHDKKILFQIKPVDIEGFTGCKAPEFRSYVWSKTVQALPNDPRMHRMLFMYSTDATVAGTAVRYHYGRGFMPSQFYSLNHSAWLHSHDFQADNWMLYENAYVAGDGGRTLTNSRVWTESGRLICSVAQEGLLRARNANSG